MQQEQGDARAPGINHPIPNGSFTILQKALDRGRILYRDARLRPSQLTADKQSA